MPPEDRPAEGDVPEHPVAREGAFPSVEVGEELVLLDDAGELPLYHNLNRQAVAIWTRCDGRSLEAIAEETGLPLEAVQLGVAELSDAGLLTESHPLSISRRATLRIIALATGLTVLPAVASITAPGVAAYGTVADGNPCSSNADCAHGCCVGNVCRGLGLAQDELCVPGCTCYTGLCCASYKESPSIMKCESPSNSAWTCIG